MKITFRRLLGAVVFLAGALIIGTSSALAASSSQGTTLSLTVPATVSLTGLAASYSVTAPAGVATNVDTGPITISTNNGTGYTFKIAAAAANFVGTANAAHTFPVNADTFGTCSSTFTGCVMGPILTTTGTTISTTSAPSTDVIGVRNQILVPAAAVPDTYTVSLTYTATTNP